MGGQEAAQNNAAREEHEKDCDCKVAVAVAITDRRGCGSEKKGVAGVRAALPGAQNTSAPPGQRCSDPTCPVGLPMRAGAAAAAGRGAAAAGAGGEVRVAKRIRHGDHWDYLVQNADGSTELHHPYVDAQGAHQCELHGTVMPWPAVKEQPAEPGTTLPWPAEPGAAAESEGDGLPMNWWQQQQGPDDDDDGPAASAAARAEPSAMRCHPAKAAALPAALPAAAAAAAAKPAAAPAKKLQGGCASVDGQRIVV